MDSFEGKLAVVTGGGSGMGRELVVQLAAGGCSVAACDLNAASAVDTAEVASAGAPSNVRVTAHACDVSDAEAVDHFRDEVVAQHQTDHVNLLFNNAGIAGAGSFITDDRQIWERVFNVCWGGVYNCSRAFVPLVVASDDGYIVNTSSINGFWATHGPGAPSTAYGSAKFAVRGFSEALIEDLRINAPHVRVAVVMPGSIGTGILRNSTRIRGDTDEFECLREIPASTGFSLADATSEEVSRLGMIEDETYQEFADVSASEAAKTILEAVRAGSWRVLVGEDARELDRAVRAEPESIYDPGFEGLAFPAWLMPMLALRVLFDSRRDPDFVAAIEVRHDADRIAIRVSNGSLVAVRGAIEEPDATVVVDPQTLYGLVVGETTLSDVEGSGLSITGDRGKFERLLAAVVGR